MLIELVAALLERIDGALHRGIAQPPGDREPLAQPDDAGKAVEHPKTLFVWARDEQAAIVGAKVQRSVHRPSRSSRRPLGAMSPSLRCAVVGRIHIRPV